MASPSDLGDRIEKEFMKHGWTQVRKGQGMLYERPLSKKAHDKMVYPKKTTLTKRKSGLQAVKRILARWFM